MQFIRLFTSGVLLALAGCGTAQRANPTANDTRTTRERIAVVAEESFIFGKIVNMKINDARFAGPFVQTGFLSSGKTFYCVAVHVGVLGSFLFSDRRILTVVHEKLPSGNELLMEGRGGLDGSIGECPAYDAMQPFPELLALRSKRLGTS